MQFEKHHVALVTNIFISYLNPYTCFSPRLRAHTLPQLALLFPTSCCSAEGSGLVAKYTEGLCRSIWPRNMKNLLWWNSTFQCCIRGYTALCYTCVWQSPFVVVGGTTKRVFRERKCAQTQCNLATSSDKWFPNRHGASEHALNPGMGSNLHNE